MSIDPEKAKAIFLEAVENHAPEQWAEFLDAACHDAPDLRRRVEELLDAHQGEDSLLDRGVGNRDSLLPTFAQPITEGPGTVIGRYKLLEQIGEGGFGVVFMAQQEHPVRRRVALKIIKPGMDTREVIARFEAERQALAIMDHPNIAKVLDAGATESGRPYFVMELVRGIPITEFCDQNGLTTRQRLELFATVCQAVQHAHQKGIIHRDIKPSNVLVTLRDDWPVPKVIDFGVAKAIDQRLTEKTVFTRFAQMIGTPLYMSPEQAGMSDLDVDTRSDIYSLGVLLYELLTGTTPFDQERVRAAAYDELLRIIREEDPPRPSLRISTLGDTLPSVAAHRRTEPKKLTALVRGELDWIVMRALEKDRTRRYATANSFGADVQRYLHDKPVHACPPSAAYRFQKFARRNMAVLTFLSAAVLTLVAVSIGAGVAAARFRDLAGRNADLAAEKQAALATAIAAEKAATTARDREQTQREEAERQTKIARSALADAQQQRERAETNFALARSAVDKFLNQVVKHELLTVPGLQPLRQELLSSAMEFYDDFTQDAENASELLVELATAHYRIAVIRGELGQKKESEASTAKSIELFEQLRRAGNDSPDVQLGLAKSYFRAGRYDDTVTLCQAILATDAKHAEARSLLADTYNSLAIDEKNAQDMAAALKYHQQALALREGLVHEFPGKPDYLAELGATLNNLGVLLDQQNKGPEALAMFERGVGCSAEAYRHAPQTILWGRWLANGLRNVAITQAEFGNDPEALDSYQRLVAVRRKLAFENPFVPSLKGDLYKAYRELGNCERRLGDTAAAERSLRAARDVLENIPHDTPDELFTLATVYGALAIPADGGEEPTAVQLDDQQRYANRAMETLTEAVDAGYRNLKALRSHKDLAALREREDFQKLADRLEKETQAEQLAAKQSGTDVQSLPDRRQAVDKLRELVTSEPEKTRYQKALAAGLHSIGVTQTYLKQFDEAKEPLNEALQIRAELRSEQPDDPALAVDWLATRAAIGQLYWRKAEYPRAHQIWQRCLAETLQLAEAHRDNKSVVRTVGDIERRIYEHYASCGLFPLVHEFAKRQVEFERLATVHTDDFVTDGEFSAVVLQLNDRDLAQRFFEQLGDAMWASHNPSLIRYDWVYLARGIAVLGADSPLSEDAQKRNRQLLDEWGARGGWIAVAVAIQQYRAEQYGEAQETLAPFPSSNPQIAFLDAAIAWKLGDKARARQRWAEGEKRYRRSFAEALAREPIDERKGIFVEHWWHIAYWQVMRRLATEVMSGDQPPAADPWQHLIQARGYGMIGETEKAEAELAAASAAAPGDAEIWLARVRLFEMWNEIKRAEAEWQKIVQLAGDDPLPWIRRGRWYAERGQHEKADADFAHAASLTPNELNKFLEAGWWVVGPYPTNLDEFCPPEIDPDPSRPLYVLDPTTGLSDEPVAWRSADFGKFGTLMIRDVLGDSSGSAYALALIYSPDDRTAFFRVGLGNGVRIWCNGRLVFQSNESCGPVHQAARVPVALRPGRNQILVRTALSDSLAPRLADTPADCALALAEQGLWRQAAEATFAKDDLEFGEPSFGDQVWFETACVQIALLLGDEQLLNRVGHHLLAMATSDPSPWKRVRASQALFLVDNPILREHGDAIAESLANQISVTKDPPRRSNIQRLLLKHAVFAGRFNESDQWRDLTAPTSGPLRAVLEHKRNNFGQALAQLDRSFETAVKVKDERWWCEYVWLVAQLREAERLITGGTVRTDELLEQQQQAALADWNSRDPVMAAFDHVIATYVSNANKVGGPAYPYLARGRRLAELGRFDKARADYDKALELAPDDAEVRIARSAFFAERGDLDHAAAELSSVFDSAAGGDEHTAWRIRHSAALEAAARPELFDRLIALRPDRPDNEHLWMARLGVDAVRGDLAAAHEAARQLEPFGYHPQRASVALLRGDLREFERIRDSRPTDWNPLYTAQLLVLAPADESHASELLAAAEKVFEERPDDWNHRLLWGAAQYRAGKLREALAQLEPAAASHRRGEVWPLLSMIHHELGDEAQARQWLERSEMWTAWHHPRTPIDMHHIFKPGVNDLQNWLRAAVFHREAQRLIRGAEPSATG
jgi:serine/threonine protein kinase/tetratricopeptide (TPR) repeat protein/Flp pilus assembly protein TadD